LKSLDQQRPLKSTEKFVRKLETSSIFVKSCHYK